MNAARGRRTIRYPAKSTKKRHWLLYCGTTILVVLVVFFCLILMHSPTPKAALSLETANAIASTAPMVPVAQASATISSTVSASATASALLAAPSTTPQLSTKSSSLAVSVSPAPQETKETENPQTKPAITQLVVVISSGGSAAKVSFYELNAGKWVKKLGVNGCVGKAGLTAASGKEEGDMKTPKGLYSLGLAFGTEKPETQMDFRLITKNSYWVDDPASGYYNTWQEGYKGWKSAEKLLSHADSYHYAVVINYNTDRIPGKGSAIFFHCKARGYTAGCVSIPKKSMLEILSILDPSKHPSILIASNANEVNSFGLVKLP